MASLNRSVEVGVAYVSFNRPESQNALNEASAGEFLSFLEEVDQDTTVRAVVIGGKGAFCSGIDPHILDNVGLGRKWADLGSLLEVIFHPVIRRVRSLSKPTIAMIDGVAAGSGMSIALGCDFRFGTANARFVSAFTRLALIPDCGGVWFLARMVGFAKALEIVALSMAIDAREAQRLGLLTWRSEADNFGPELRQYVDTVAALPRLALLEMRQTLEEFMTVTFGQALETELVTMRMLGGTDDYAKGLRAVKDKRLPKFSS